MKYRLYMKTHFPTNQTLMSCIARRAFGLKHQTKYRIKFESARANRLILLELQFDWIVLRSAAVWYIDGWI